MGWLVSLIRWLVRLVGAPRSDIGALGGYSEALRIYLSGARPLYLAWPSKALRASRKPSSDTRGSRKPSGHKKGRGLTASTHRRYYLVIIISRLTEGAKRGVEDMRLLGGVLFVLILVAILVELVRLLS